MQGNIFTGSRDQNVDFFGKPLFCLLQGCFQMLAIMNLATVNICKSISVCVCLCVCVYINLYLSGINAQEYNY